jgi:hypothetical protein
MPDTPEVFDPFDPETLRQTSLADIAVERVMLSVPVKRPGKQEFFRVHPDLAYTLDAYLLERTDGLDRETFLVTPNFHAELLGELRLKRIFTCVNKRGTVFLWPANVPTPDNTMGRSWAESALQIADYAKTSWVRMVGRRDANDYEMFKAKGDLGSPEWPDKSFRDLLALAFAGDGLIDREDHPVIRELNGEL